MNFLFNFILFVSNISVLLFIIIFLFFFNWIISIKQLLFLYWINFILLFFIIYFIYLFLKIVKKPNNIKFVEIKKIENKNNFFIPFYSFILIIICIWFLFNKIFINTLFIIFSFIFLFLFHKYKIYNLILHYIFKYNIYKCIWKIEWKNRNIYILSKSKIDLNKKYQLIEIEPWFIYLN